MANPLRLLSLIPSPLGVRDYDNGNDGDSVDADDDLRHFFFKMSWCVVV